MVDPKLVEKYADACRRNAIEMSRMPIEAIRQHFREFADEVIASLASELETVKAEYAEFVKQHEKEVGLSASIPAEIGGLVERLSGAIDYVRDDATPDAINHVANTAVSAASALRALSVRNGELRKALTNLVDVSQKHLPYDSPNGECQKAVEASIAVLRKAEISQ